MSERRSQPRLPNHQLVTISWEENSQKFNQLGTVHDGSPGGIGVFVSQGAAVGTPVTISYPHGDLEGIVRHRSQLIGGTLIGIEFSESAKAPAEHFLNLSTTSY